MDTQWPVFLPVRPHYWVLSRSSSRAAKEHPRQARKRSHCPARKLAKQTNQDVAAEAVGKNNLITCWSLVWSASLRKALPGSMVRRFLRLASRTKILRCSTRPNRAARQRRSRPAAWASR